MRRMGWIVWLLTISMAVAAQEGEPKPQTARPTEGARPAQPVRLPGVRGVIKSIESTTMKVRAFDGQTVTVHLSDKTEYRKDRNPAKLADFQAGDMVFVRGQEAPDHSWTADAVGSNSEFRENLGKKFVLGDIKSIAGTQLTVERVDGVSQTITVDENTSFRKNGESVTLADFKAGDRIFAQGEVKNGTFVATTMGSGEMGMMRPGGPPSGRDQVPH